MLTNDDLTRGDSVAGELIERLTGIRERRTLESSFVTSDLAADAGRAACVSAGIHPSQLSCILIATATPDTPVPSTAVQVQRKLGAENCMAFDISAACAGFLYGLAVADGLVRRDSLELVLVIGAEVLSRVLDWNDRETTVLFGDGAGAVIIGSARSGDMHSSRLVSTDLRADGSGAGHLLIPAGGSAQPATQATVGAGLHKARMNGKAVFVNAVRRMTASCQLTLQCNGLTPLDVDLVVAHQANRRILAGVAERSGIPYERLR